MKTKQRTNWEMTVPALLADAARLAGLDANITDCKPQTFAEKMAFGTKRVHHKNSFLYCDAVDACFFYTESRQPVVCFTARWGIGYKDITDQTRILNTFGKINTMLSFMKRLADEYTKAENEGQLI